MRLLNIYGFKNTKGIKICSHNVNRMESKFDETKKQGQRKAWHIPSPKNYT